MARPYEIEAFVQPERIPTNALFFPGELSSIQASWRHVLARANGTYASGGLFQNNMPYGIRAQVKEERLSGLLKAHDLTASQLRAWRQDDDLSPTLDIPDNLRKQLSPIVGEIRSKILARGRGRDLDNPYAKANAVRDYLVANCTYSLSSPLVPATDDAVVFFLTKSRRGACDMFASSMVLLLRALNVPARLATGYIEPSELTDGRVTTNGSTIASILGDTKSKGATAAPARKRVSANGRSIPPVLTFAMREKDAHAWVEYFVPQAGWLTYDPTAGTRTTELPIEEQLATMFHLPSLNISLQTLWLPLCGLLLISIGVVWSVVDSKSRQNRVPLGAADLVRAEISTTYEQAVRALARHVPAKPHLTPLEFESFVNHSQISQAAKQEFTAITYLLIAARYNAQPPELAKGDLAACLRRLRRALGQF
jgi:transglutaminase-like putative cysteine protease